MAGNYERVEKSFDGRVAKITILFVDFLLFLLKILIQATKEPRRNDVNFVNHQTTFGSINDKIVENIDGMT
jgi:hypothetical protein